ncbi:hypothetical protein EJ06DRAFT_179227 [Trichodelitschia bisporula]|uniref:Uncharacterized protein n=1 Tax=Trichodelitschia bisporula TaxID=703511 RepID=A0A6G1HLN7_9PEZI|nr:hypothetical protein EJ06DRAFT_179227 [Trichodelitschia bisporula]
MSECLCNCRRFLLVSLPNTPITVLRRFRGILGNSRLFCPPHPTPRILNLTYPPGVYCPPSAVAQPPPVIFHSFLIATIGRSQIQNAVRRRLKQRLWVCTWFLSVVTLKAKLLCNLVLAWLPLLAPRRIFPPLVFCRRMSRDCGGITDHCITRLVLQRNPTHPTSVHSTHNSFNSSIAWP